MATTLPVGVQDTPSVTNYSFIKKATYAACITTEVVGALFVALAAAGVFGYLNGVGAIAALSGGVLLCLISTVIIALLCRNAQQPPVVQPLTSVVTTQAETTKSQPAGSDAQGHYPIHRAVMKNQKEEVEKLINENKNNVNLRDGAQKTPLQFAVIMGHTSMVQLLLERGADPNACDARQNTPMSCAIQYDKREIAKILFKAGAHGLSTFASVIDVVEEAEKHLPLEGTSIHWAARCGDVGVLEQLIIEASSADKQDRNGQTPLHVAAMEGRLECVRTLLEHGKANVNATDRWTRTPLHWAVRKNQFDIATYLVAAKTKLDLPDEYVNTVLHLSVWWSSSEMTDLLLKNGVDSTAVNGDQQTPLHLSVRRGKVVETKMLLDTLNLQSKLDAINLKDSFGCTPLHWAAKRGDEKIVEMLLEHKAKISIQDNEGKTAIEVSTNKSIKETLQKKKDTMDSAALRGRSKSVPQDMKKQTPTSPKKETNQDLKKPNS